MGKKSIADLPDFDLAEHLKSEEDIAHYLAMVMAEGDASELAHASCTTPYGWQGVRSNWGLLQPRRRG